MIYADSSAIVKRYYQEPGSDRVHDRWMQGDRVFTSRVAYAEVHVALARKRRDGTLAPALYRRSASAFDDEWSAYEQIAVDAATMADVVRLVRRYPLRGYDAIHLSAALWVQRQVGDAMEFWASDERLEQAANRERILVVNPAI
jgi:predicted nucleic acid-binding protein